MENIHESSQIVVLDNSVDAETIISATVAYEASMAAADRLTNFDDGDEDDVHDNQDVDANRQNMREQVDDGHGEDGFGSEVDPEDEGSVADAIEVGEDVCDSTHEQGSEAKDVTEDGRGMSASTLDVAGPVEPKAFYEPFTIVLPMYLSIFWPRFVDLDGSSRYVFSAMKLVSTRSLMKSG
ncbi:hypothetical protein PsorP6_006622 [Peronosclerospora sorghi]|uniref:Uncharacterized protein n=1 Tax=Peronosclerospora sorghi TaxID=230839 RepID=A0ACC0W4M7_9STRA|nr:hypothetical protein PsorP6_006622 [Peronosclerospora sorghi]